VPSGVKVESMMYVGMAFLPSSSIARITRLPKVVSDRSPACIRHGFDGPLPAFATMTAPVRPRSVRLPSALAAAALLAAAASAAAAPADAATVTLAPACYHSGQLGWLTGSGFKPSTHWTAKLRGTQRLGSGKADGTGNIRARFTAPAYHGTTGERELTLSVTDGPHVASTVFRMTPLTASFSPSSGDPNTLRVRWRVLGLDAGHGVYVHYVRPNGKLRTTLRIGSAQGACGHLKTRPLALFPFGLEYGRWTFQIDASRGYRRTTVPRLLIQYDVTRPRAKAKPGARGH
jgi:hypothetical protein